MIERAGPPADPICTYFGVAHDFAEQLHHLVRHRRREEQRLAFLGRRQRLRDAADIGPEAHVHHAVRLVEHEGVDAREVDGAAALVIHQASRRGDDDVDAGLERALLRPHLDAAVDGDAGEVGVVSEALHIVFDLHAELARRREDEDAGVAVVRPAFWARALSMRLRIGSTKATVLPVPVSAQPMTSWPPSAIGMTALWIAVVFSKPRTSTPSSSDGSRPSESKATGAGS